MKRFASSAAVVSLVFGLMSIWSGPAARGDLVTWRGFSGDGGDGIFGLSSCWDAGRVPGPNDLVGFGTQVGDVSGIVAVTADVTNQNALVASVDRTLALGTHTYTLQPPVDNSDPENPIRLVPLWVAGCLLSIENGTVQTLASPGFPELVEDVHVEEGGELRVLTSGSLQTAGDILVSVNEPALSTLTVSNGGEVLAGGGCLLGGSSTHEGALVVDQPGSACNISGYLDMAVFGEATVTVSNGGTLSVDQNSFLSRGEGGSAEVTVTGPGSSWTTAHQLQVGGYGSGTITVSNGGAVTVNGDVTLLGWYQDATGEVTVTGADSTWTNTGQLIIGVESQAASTMTISNGGTISVSDATAIARFEGSSGDVTVTGTDSTWTNTGQLIIGLEAAGTATISDGGAFSVIDAVIVGLEGTAHGQITLSNGGTLSADDISILGRDEGSLGEATVTGPGSTWTGAAQLQVGTDGQGILTIAQGGVVSTSKSGSPTGTAGLIGVHSTGTGKTTVTGAGSQWNNVDGVFVVGFSGQGELEVFDGGVVSSVGGFIGRDPGSTGLATVSGTGSQWTSSEELNIAVGPDGGPDGGPGGTGSLTVADGGRVIAPTIKVGPDGEILGNGLLEGNVVNGGLVAPGNSAGLLTIDGDYQQLADGTLEMEIGGLPPGDEFDVLQLTGNATLAGKLTVRVIGGFVPNQTDTFAILTAGSRAGTFDTVSFSGGTFELDYSQSGLTLLNYSPPDLIPGDANGDGKVTDADAAILATHWQQSGASWEDGDFNNDGKVTDADAAILATHWQEGTEGEPAPVPEPAPLVLLATALLWLPARRWAKAPRLARCETNLD